MTIRNRYGSVTDELNFEDVKQYHTKCEKYDDATGEIVYAVDLYYLEADKNNDFLFLSHFSDNATAITGYDKYDLLNPDFLMSRIHPDENPEEIFMVNPDKENWEHYFLFKKPHGVYTKTRISFQKSREERYLSTWQFLPS